MVLTTSDSAGIVNMKTKYIFVTRRQDGSWIKETTHRFFGVVSLLTDAIGNNFRGFFDYSSELKVYDVKPAAGLSLILLTYVRTSQ